MGKARLLVLDEAATRTSAQPEQRRDLLEGHAQLDGVWIFVGEVKEDGVFLEAVGHGELVGELVVALDGVTLGRLAVMAAVTRGLVTYWQMPSASQSGSP